MSRRLLILLEPHAYAEQSRFPRNRLYIGSAEIAIRSRAAAVVADDVRAPADTSAGSARLFAQRDNGRCLIPGLGRGAGLRRASLLRITVAFLSHRFTPSRLNVTQDAANASCGGPLFGGCAHRRAGLYTAQRRASSSGPAFTTEC